VALNGVPASCAGIHRQAQNESRQNRSGEPKAGPVHRRRQGMWDVLGFGVVAVDDLVYVDTYPAADSKAPIREERRDGGGLAGTALVAAARLGARAAYGGILGDDELALYTMRALQGESIDCSAVHRQPGARPTHSVIIVDRSTGHRTILFGSTGVVLPRIEDFAAVIPNCRVLFVDSTIADFGMEAIRLAHQHDIQVVVDLERDVNDSAMELGRRVDHLIIGSAYGGRATGMDNPADMVRALRSPQHITCVVTHGEMGCWYATRETGEEVRHFPAYSVQAVDTTGCGDVFHGAFAATIARGQSVLQAIRVASATAAIKATKPGGRFGIPDLATVERFLAADPVA
jgi:sulfofructose kinase